MTENFYRIVDLEDATKSQSIFLLGPRQTGKSWLLCHQLSNTQQFNLLQTETFLSLSAAPSRLRDAVKPNSLVVIDEIQRLPDLLNEIHLLIEEQGNRFILTGSSARKLRSGGDLIFEEMLNGWWNRTSDWPKDRSYEAFNLWFSCEHHSLILDLVADPLLRETDE